MNPPTTTKLKRTIQPLTVGAILGLGIGFAIGAILVWKKGRFSAALEENKIAVVLLTQKSVPEDTAFGEYLKGRIYYNIASKFPNDRGYLLRSDWDFGPVNVERFGYGFAKDPGFECESFDAATKHLSRAEPAGGTKRD